MFKEGKWYSSGLNLYNQISSVWRNIIETYENREQEYLRRKAIFFLSEYI